MPTTRSQTKNKSATKIQAATRGRQTRRKIKTNKSSRKSSPKSSPKECPICLEEISKKDASKIQCSNKHLYHNKCIKRWMKQNANCPICRENLLPNNKEKIIKLLDSFDYEGYVDLGELFYQLKNKLLVTAEYKDKNLPKVEQNLISLIDEYFDLLQGIHDLKNNETEIDFLASKSDGLEILHKILLTTQDTKDKIVKLRYPKLRLLERKIGDYNLELLDKPTRRIDAISRPPHTERAETVRYTRSE